MTTITEEQAKIDEIKGRHWEACVRHDDVIKARKALADRCFDGDREAIDETERLNRRLHRIRAENESIIDELHAAEGRLATVVNKARLAEVGK